MVIRQVVDVLSEMETHLKKQPVQGLVNLLEVQLSDLAEYRNKLEEMTETELGFIDPLNKTPEALQAEEDKAMKSLNEVNYNYRIRSKL